MRIGAVVGRGAAIWARGVPSFAFVAVATSVPVIAYTWYVPSSSWGELGGNGAFLAAAFGYLVLWAASTCFLVAAVSCSVARSVDGSRAGFLSPFAAFAHALPLLGLTGVLMAIFVGLGFAMGFLAAFSVSPPFLLVVGLVLGSLVTSALWVVVPAAVVERRGPLSAVRASLTLTRGNRWLTFAVSVGLYALTWLLTWSVNSLFFAEPGLGSERVQVAAEILLYAGIVTFGSSLCAVAHHDLRTSLEGESADALAKVFE
jgi:hypothetical protein